MVNPDRPWPRPETPRPQLDATSNETLEFWAAQPEFDTRSLEEFAAEGGRPVGPPNRMEGGPGIIAGFFAFAWGLPWLAWRAFRWALELLDFRRSSIDHALERGRFYELPPGLELIPLPRAPKGGTGETDRHGRKIPPKPNYRPPAPPPKNFETGHLRSSLPPGGAGGQGVVIIIDDPTLGPDQVLGINSRNERRSSGGGWPT